MKENSLYRKATFSKDTVCATKENKTEIFKITTLKWTFSF